MNAFRPPKTSIRPYTPVNELKDVNYIKNEIKPNGGPLTIPQTPHVAIAPNTNPMAFNKLKAMFAKGR